MQNDNSKIWIIIGIIAALGLIYVGVTGFGKSALNTVPGETGAETDNGENGATASAVPEKSAEEIKLEEVSSKKLNAEPGSPDAPAQSNPITSAAEVAPDAIKLTVSSAGFLPAALSVKSGAMVTLAITSLDAQSHVFKFDSPELSGIAVGLGPQETREISFIAPRRGEYTFFCDVPGHRSRGEIGVMVVQ